MGFWQGSHISNLLSLYSKVYEPFENGSTVYIDFGMAFDRIFHERLRMVEVHGIAGRRSKMDQEMG